MSNMELRLAGSGGQGVILATVILAEAAILAGKYTAQSQAYGPEARGGSCKAEVLISEAPIGFTKVQKPTFLMVLTQKALDDYGRDLPENCVVLADESLQIPQELNLPHLTQLPILRTAQEKVGKAMTANIVAVGAINALLGLVSQDVLREAVMLHVPKGTEALNARAMYEHETVIPAMEAARQIADELEGRVGKEYWPMPSYADLLFYV